MRKIFIRLTDADVDRLVRRAQAERRHPSDEAAVLLGNALGALEDTPDGTAAARRAERVA